MLGYLSGLSDIIRHPVRAASGLCLVVILLLLQDGLVRLGSCRGGKSGMQLKNITIKLRKNITSIFELNWMAGLITYGTF